MTTTTREDAARRGVRTLAADLHLASAIPVAKYVEFLTPAPYIDEILTEPFRLDAAGLLSIRVTDGNSARNEPDRGRQAKPVDVGPKPAAIPVRSKDFDLLLLAHENLTVTIDSDAKRWARRLPISGRLAGFE